MLQNVNGDSQPFFPC